MGCSLSLNAFLLGSSRIYARDSPALNDKD
jgi:hypothetical protein